MREILLAVFGTLFVWWASTGSIIYLAGLPQRTHKWTLGAATLILIASCAGLYLTRNDTSVQGALLAFVCGIGAWSWLEVSYYTGYVTGMRIPPCAEQCSGWRHFVHAIQANMWHELAALALGALSIALTWDGANPFGRWAVLILLWMHESARLNIFLGVPNLGPEALPAHLMHQRHFFTQKPMNVFFPFAVTVSTAVTVWVIGQALAPDATPFWRVGCAAAGTLMALAVLEHWLLVLPIPSAQLWNWGLKSRQPESDAEATRVETPDALVAAQVVHAHAGHPAKEPEDNSLAHDGDAEALKMTLKKNSL